LGLKRKRRGFKRWSGGVEAGCYSEAAG